jgi:hypothetical protein
MLLLIKLGLTAVLAAGLTAGVAAAAPPCDRACLSGKLDRYLSAFLKHDPKAAPLAPGFRYTENANTVRPGEGLWKTLSALGKVQRRYLDAVNGQAVYFGQVVEGGVTNLATMRIRVADGKINEGEVVVGRKVDLLFDADGFTASPPPDKPLAKQARTSREALIAAAQSYFDGIQNHDSSKVLRVDGCGRFENGQVTAGPVPNAPAQSGSAGGAVIRGDCGSSMESFKTTISEVVHRRYPVVDEEAGVVLGIVVFNRPPGAKRDNGSWYPRNLLTEVFAVENGRIRNIWAIMHYMDPDVPSAPGW